MKQLLRILIVAGLFCIPSLGQAADEINADSNGVMVKGYDVVAYFTSGKPTVGIPNYKTTYNGGVYLFSSAEHLEMFTADPAKYAPAYGGYCSYGVRVGKKFEIDPTAFKITGGRLFLQLDRGTHLLWNEEMEKNISISDRIWPSIQTTPKDML